MLKVGLIGLGADWETRYRPALLKLRPRLRVQTVYAPVSTQAEQAAAELGCHIASGLMDLVEREDVQAILVLDAAWYGEVPAQFACLAGKSAFLAAGSFEHTFPADRLACLAADKGVTLMPEFAHRYTPATSRLRELVATRLGKIVSLDVALTTAGPTSDPPRSDGTREVLTMAVDWCMSLVGSSPRAVRVVPDSGTAGTSTTRAGLAIDFRVPTAGSEAVTARIRTGRTAIVQTTDDPSHQAGGNPGVVMFRAQAQCQRGTAILEGPHQVIWESNGENKGESLVSDPADVEVMLDHFCRRVVGGLIPVPTLEDFYRASKWVDQALTEA